MTDNAYTARFSRLPTEELMRIADPSSSDEFESEAIDAARLELQSRDIDDEAAAQISEQITEEKEAEAIRANLPLSNAGWVLFVLIGPVLILSLALAAAQYGLGFKQRALHALSAIMAGFVFYAAIGFIAYLVLA